MIIGNEVVTRMEACIKQTHIEVTRQYSNGRIFEINGGAACFSGVDSFLSQVVGWGFTTKLKHFKTEIEAIEQFYKTMGHSQVDIELCPFVGNSLAVALSQRGYGLAELSNVSVYDVTIHQPKRVNEDGFLIKIVDAAELDEWAKRVAFGFGYPEAQNQFFHYSNAKGVTAFAVYDHNQIIAGATIAMHGDACDLGVTSTLPKYRGLGLQKKLVQHRLDFARQHGLNIAMVTTEPGSISDLNIQKMGFRCAYTRIKMSKNLPK